MTDQEFEDRLEIALRKHLSIEYTYRVYSDDPTPKCVVKFKDAILAEFETEFSID